MTLLTEVIDRRTGRVRVSGQLTSQGADLPRGTVENLHRLGLPRAVLDLEQVRAADWDGMSLLRSLRATIAAAGGELVLSNQPDVS